MWMCKYYDKETGECKEYGKEKYYPDFCNEEGLCMLDGENFLSGDMCNGFED